MTGADNQWYLDALHIREAQQITKGKGIRVCIIDTPIYHNLSVLRGVSWASESGSESVFVPPASDSWVGHGSRVATLLASQNVNGDLTGVAPAVTIEWQSMSSKEPRSGEPLPASASLALAIKACADHGSSIINMSIGGPISDARSQETVAKAVAYAQMRDAVIVSASGNGGTTSVLGIEAPARFFGVLATAGTDMFLRGDKGSTRGGASFNNPTHPSVTDSQGIALEGPSTVHGWDVKMGRCEGITFPPDTPGGSTPVCGTSLATPVVAGIAALVRAAHPDLNAANTINRILKTATLPPGTPPNTTLPSPYFGYGIPNAYKAITATIPPTDHNPLGSLYTGGRGIWQPTTTPRRPEPPTGNHPTPTPWQNVTLDDPANPNPTPSTTSSSSGSNTSSGSGSSSNAATPTNATPTTSGGGTPPWLYPTLATTLTLTAAALTLTRRRRRNTTP